MVEKDYDERVAAMRPAAPSEAIETSVKLDGVALRRAIHEGLREKNMSVAEAARRAGLKSASAVHNHLSHLSSTLSYATATRLSKVLGFDLTVVSDLPPLPPSEELEQLARQADQVNAPLELRQLIKRLRKVVGAQAIGTSAIPPSILADELLMVSVNVDEEGRRLALMMPEAMREPLTGRMSSRDAGRRAFGARVIGAAAEPLYRTGTVLICVPIAKGRKVILKAGRRVLCCVRTAPRRRETRWKLFSVEIREVTYNHARGGLELAPIGVDRDACWLELPPSISNKPWTSRGFDIKVSGIVISSVVPEEDTHDHS